MRVPPPSVFCLGVRALAGMHVQHPPTNSVWGWYHRSGFFSGLRPQAAGLSSFRPGQILVIVLIGILLLGGMIFYVINVGEQLNGHLSMQNAADSTAISGATWMARSMNVVAMNNVAQTRLLALVPIRYRVLLYANPLVGVLGAMRCALMAAPPPPGLAISAALAWTCTLMVVGLWLFDRRAGPVRDLA